MNACRPKVSSSQQGRPGRVDGVDGVHGIKGRDPSHVTFASQLIINLVNVGGLRISGAVLQRSGAQELHFTDRFAMHQSWIFSLLTVDVSRLGHSHHSSALFSRYRFCLISQAWIVWDQVILSTKFGTSWR